MNMQQTEFRITMPQPPPGGDRDSMGGILPIDPPDLPGDFPIDPPVETVDLPGDFPIDPPVETVDLPGDFPIPVPDPDDTKS